MAPIIFKNYNSYISEVSLEEMQGYQGSRSPGALRSAGSVRGRTGNKTRFSADIEYLMRQQKVMRDMRHLMTKPTKWHVCPAKTQINLGIRPVWSESSLCAQWVAKDPSFLHADSEDSDQTGRMPRLIWVFAGGTCHFVGFVTRWLICKLSLTLWLQKSLKLSWEKKISQMIARTCQANNINT